MQVNRWAKQGLHSGWNEVSTTAPTSATESLRRPAPGRVIASFACHLCARWYTTNDDRPLRCAPHTAHITGATVEPLPTSLDDLSRPGEPGGITLEEMETLHATLFAR